MEVRYAHPRFERTKRMFDRCPADSHGLRQSIQPLEHGVSDIFIRPAFNPSLFSCRAFRLNRTGPASISLVNLHILALLNRCEAVTHILPRWTLITIVLGLIDKIMFAKEANFARILGIGFRDIQDSA